MAERERDRTGKPLNARPRDGLGRPLARGAEGVPRIPDDVQLPPDESLTEAQRLLDHNMPFHAHEILEGTWKIADEDERELWQGLAQLAVGLTHLLRGNNSGAITLLQRGHDRIRHYEQQPPHLIDVSGLMTWADHLVLEVERGADLSTVPIPRLRIP
ncbi:DUF309 domain-containing protein [Rhodococcus sp. NPDC058521]|uniref:DUF309 domain-containing protein n=1 Tax=Rhodococcus sp. NPDC058521 TaxID=3346536 RepID=UPI00366949E5